MRSSAGVIAIAWGKGADVGVRHKTVRKRAVGTRERIVAYLTEAGELSDVNGMASTQLAAAVGYPGSSVAFAQLLSGMERSGLIEREVRGKRTYRIGLGAARMAGVGSVFGARAGAGVGVTVVPRRAGASGVGAMAVGPSVVGASAVGASAAVGPLAADGAADGFDYDELARRLLVQVVRRLAAVGPEAGPADRPAPADQAALQQTVTG